MFNRGNSPARKDVWRRGNCGIWTDLLGHFPVLLFRPYTFVCSQLKFFFLESASHPKTTLKGPYTIIFTFTMSLLGNCRNYGSSVFQGNLYGKITWFFLTENSSLKQSGSEIFTLAFVFGWTSAAYIAVSVFITITSGKTTLLYVSNVSIWIFTCPN